MSRQGSGEDPGISGSRRGAGSEAASRSGLSRIGPSRADDGLSPLSPPVVFLSHSGADTEAARELKRRLLASAGRADGRPESLVRQGRSEAGNVVVGADRRRDPESGDRLRRLCRLGRGDELGRGRGRSRAFARDDRQAEPAPVHSGPRRRKQGLERAAALRQALSGRARPARRRRRAGQAPQGGPRPRTGTRRRSSSTSPSSACGRCARRSRTASSAARRRSTNSPKNSASFAWSPIVADSGTGKSSLARAGFAPAFRGGALIDPAREEARDKIWQVVTMRPRADPAEGLRQGVDDSRGKARPLARRVASLREQRLGRRRRARPPLRCNAACRRRKPRRC